MRYTVAVSNFKGGDDGSMQCDVLHLTVDYARAGLQETGQPRLHAYLLENWSDNPAPPVRPALIICPGGGYGMTSNREAEPIAAQFCAQGFHCFVLRYSVSPMPFPGALLELSAAVALVRSRAAEWHIHPEQIYVCGFSAGGHLAGSLGVFWNRDFIKESLGYRQGEHKPNGMVLCYPVITAGAFAHEGSIQNLLQHRREQRELVSLENQVSTDTPPAFIWHTMEDPCVPVENSLLMASALRAKGIPFELHVYQHGGHGLSLASGLTEMTEPSCQNWISMAVRWMRSLSADK